MTSSSPKHLSKFDSILWFWTKTGGKQFAAHCLRGAVIGRLEERWVQQGKPKLARRSFYLNQEKKSVLSTKPWSFWAEVLLDSPDHVQAPSCWQNQLTMALNWTYRAFFRELAHARGATSEVSVLLRFICGPLPTTQLLEDFGSFQCSKGEVHFWILYVLLGLLWVHLKFFDV